MTYLHKLIEKQVLLKCSENDDDDDDDYNENNNNKHKMIQYLQRL